LKGKQKQDLWNIFKKELNSHNPSLLIEIEKSLNERKKSSVWEESVVNDDKEFTFSFF